MVMDDPLQVFENKHSSGEVFALVGVKGLLVQILDVVEAAARVSAPYTH